LAQLATVAMFALLALIAVMRARRGGRAGRWAAVTFGSLAVVLLTDPIEDALGVEPPAWLRVVTILLLIGFPYLLLRFTASFGGFPRWLEIVAATGAASIAVATVALLRVPESSSRDGAGLYVAAALVYWVLLSLVTVLTLWRAGHGQPTVARRRMRMMSGATAVLAVAMLMALLLGEASAAVQLSVQITALASAAAFALGLSPPSALRVLWRRTEEAHLQNGMMAVLRAGTVEEVSHELLPPTVRIVGGSSAALVDASGRVLASHGEAAEIGAELPDADTDGAGPTRQVMPLGDGRGALVVWTSSYTPFFGREEIDLLRTMGAVVTLALERSERLEDERAQRVALERAQREADRAREAAIQANQTKNKFLSRMSHELRTPLNAILGFGQLLQTSTLAADDRDGVAHIVKAGEHLLALINDVLDLSRIEADALTLSLEPVHTGELIDDAVTLIKPLADSRSLRLVVSAAECDTYVTADRQRCRQVLLNLLSNAVKYNHDGGEVQIGCRQIDERELRIWVRDSGPGIDLVRQERLFEPFERLGAENSSVEGTGLGLALTKQLVERMQGIIGVESAPGLGSTFWIDLPVAQQPAGLDEQPVARSETSSANDERTLLLVEDNLTNLRVVEAMLRRRPGISVLPAMQGSLAFDMACEHQPDVIILDLHLPDMSGHDVLQRLQADPRTRDIPVVIASADATPGRVRELQEDGAFAYLTKPLHFQQFLDVVASALAHSDGTRERRSGGAEPDVAPDPTVV
jgi:signal transduction histidine kinase/ActR/RegA family two-component response regulator